MMSRIYLFCIILTYQNPIFISYSDAQVNSALVFSIPIFNCFTVTEDYLKLQIVMNT